MRDRGRIFVLKSIAALSPTLRRFSLVPEDGRAIEPTSPGAHIRLAPLDGDTHFQNAYSLIDVTDDLSAYQIVVRRAHPSRGGSAWLHDEGRPDARFSVLGPDNLFAPVSGARTHLLMSAGVGITPFLAYARHFLSRRIPFHLHHLCRADEAEAFKTLVADFSDHVSLYHGRRAVDAEALLARQRLGTHVSVCGPEDFIEAICAVAGQVGYPRDKVHVERFTGHEAGTAFQAVLVRSNRAITVDETMSLLEALERAGIDVPSLCRGGSCGACAVPVCGGVPEHRDHVLSPDERARGDMVLTCVSRSATPILMLDL